MANAKKQQAEIIDPNRFKMAKSMSVVPGGPPNNNPMNAMVGPDPSSFSGVNVNPYGDIGEAHPEALGGVWANPVSGYPQNQTQGQMLNAAIPYGMQMQPNSQQSEFMEGGYLGGVAMEKQLVPSLMGPIGLPPQGGEVPMQGPNTLGLQGAASAEAVMEPPSGPAGGMNTSTGKR